MVILLIRRGAIRSVQRHDDDRFLRMFLLTMNSEVAVDFVEFANGSLPQTTVRKCCLES